MLGITYYTWNSVCLMYFNLNLSVKKVYLQFFPFSKVTKEEYERILSKAFFEKYINTGGFVRFPVAMHQSENYIQKYDGSFRNSSLISPVLFLVLQSIGMEIFKYYTPKRPKSIYAYYAGSYESLQPRYKQEYDEFCKKVNIYVDEYKYFIKTDITNFFANINLDILMEQIDSICNCGRVNITQTQLKWFKELIIYCGKGRYPIIENSIASSYLATIVYLDEVDVKLNKYISEKIKAFDDFKMVRYVDDMYIFFSSTEKESEMQVVYNQIRNEYSSILKEYGLSLNAQKCCLRPSYEISEELKKSLYDEYYNGNHHDIGELFAGSLYIFLQEILSNLCSSYIDIDKYNDLIMKYFKNGEIELTPNEVFNYLVFENNDEVRSEKVIDIIVKIIETDISIISLDPKRLSVLIMKTENTKAIKALLNQLFRRNNMDIWNSYDTSIAITYLIQSGFKHIDLLTVLSKNDYALAKYYNCFCRQSFMNLFLNVQINKYISVINEDWQTYFLYFMYWNEMSRYNILVAFALYKNYFDRFTADLAFCVKHNTKCKKPEYKKFYKEKENKKFYISVKNSDRIIEKAHKLRNANPMTHASADLLTKDNTSVDLQTSIHDMEKLIKDYMNIKSL